ncbi:MULTISPECIES: hypothetical protein [Pontibacillus]|uniref:Uncharacterized protein n=1 Tax=Pontibacillus chungwhensis TaxID=265426 RepID=A0ABY8UZF4_9BACI|nr:MULTISPECIES: hypothetical protein [Pontibacillus]MCD5324928.1 hypothetical protein [Pontibacillus sp. HN14]WIF98887.1 hypothetical protein QNI29_04315 [Pontibacillus chungwhensis]
MAVLYDLVREAQKGYGTEGKIVETFDPKLKSSLRRTTRENREDLEQELKLHILHYIRNSSLEDVPGLEELNNQGKCE